MRSLSRLRSLQAFEAAARHGSFTGAASELGITATAVGQLVRGLEDWTGRPVFRRSRSGKERLSVTEEADAALKEITRGLDALEEGVKRLRGSKARATVLVTASQALVANWLIFRLERFNRSHRGIDVRLDVSDRLLDLTSGEADVGLRCGPGTWKGVTATKLMDEEVIAVASPLIVPRDRKSIGKWLASQTLIDDATPHRGAGLPGWENYFSFVGASSHDGRPSLRINATAAVVQAAVAGQGVALVRRALVSNELATHRLCELFPHRGWPIRWAYYVVAAPQALRRREVASFYKWLVEDVSATTA
ncbi:MULTISPECIES: LysR substrate-binding domain-containing protein [unclassified Bradyrhizobium]|uniref:LysR substrate-binding domain-containing protein n=1 Tax=unclassified Bradyrhizobium TaxID=2631580 RepID=UPI00040A1D90|nr:MULTISPECIES: LysR substrate-binding domain-containing protein [unclassified Bradyrhizobium]QIG92927.1 LysR family transcriptional regulator [Bradyrhizobium sp. 6(2017)]